MYKLIVFDADGTLTPSRGGSCGPFTRELLPGVAEGIAALKAEGVRLAIASNQSHRRKLSTIRAQMQWTQRELGIDWVFFAHSGTDFSHKPSPDMLRRK